MLLNNRVIFSDNGTLTDYSKQASDIFASTFTMPFTLSQDYLYLGSDRPFNHRWFDVSSANAVASTPTVQIWDGTSWQTCVEVIDETSSAGKSLAVDGIITWVPDKDSHWHREESTENMTSVLDGVTIYNMYWARISWSATLTSTTAINYIGHKFAEDNQLGGLYPDLILSTFIAAHTSGKTDWKEQHVLAAEAIIRDLKKQNDINSPNQILNPDLLNEAAIHKVAEIIFNTMGKDFVDDRNNAIKYYWDAMKGFNKEVDTNKNARIDTWEQYKSVGIVRR